MEPEGSLQHSQVPATCPYPNPDQSRPRPHLTSCRSILILSFHLRLGLQSGPKHDYVYKNYSFNISIKVV